MDITEPTTLLTGAAALEAEVRARIKRIERTQAELAGTPPPDQPDDELARRRAKGPRKPPKTATATP